VEVLKYEDVTVPELKDDEVLVKNSFIGVNFIDVYLRTGLYKSQLPSILGKEASGVVEKVGTGVKNLRVGDRVAFCFAPFGYSEYSTVSEFRAVKLPDKVDLAMAAALPIQGLTAHYLAKTTYPLKAGDTALVLAGAGGVGQLLIQIAKLCGATVITTVSTKEKAALVKSLGADHTIVYDKDTTFDVEVRKLTNGKGVNVAYDSVGKDTWQQSLNSLAPLGYLVLYGNASGPVPPIDPLYLSEKGSLFVTRASLKDYIATPEAYRARFNDLLKWVDEGKLKVQTEFKFPLSQVAEAHKALEGRKTTGKVLLVPGN